MLKVLGALTLGAAFVLGFAPATTPSFAQAAPEKAIQLAQDDDGAAVEDSEMGTDEAPADDSMSDDSMSDDSMSDDAPVEDSEMGDDTSGQ
jgi:hypothetical protein